MTLTLGRMVTLAVAFLALKRAERPRKQFLICVTLDTGHSVEVPLVIPPGYSLLT